MGFETTDDAEELTEILGQDRALEAVRFGADMRAPGYNIFALGPIDTEKDELLTGLFRARAGDAAPPPDTCYVNHFGHEHEPRYLSLPPGRGRALEIDLDAFADELRNAIRATFESEEYQARRQGLEQDAQSEQAEGLERLQEEAAERGLRMARTPAGFVFAPVRDGEVLGSEEVEELSQEEQDEIQEDIEELHEQLRQVMRQVPSQQRELRQAVRDLDREFARVVVADLLDEFRSDYEDLDDVQEHLHAIQDDVVENARKLVADGDAEQPQLQMMQARQANETLRRYRVNVLVSAGGAEGAPVIHEENPTYENLIGRIEYQAQMGALTTDFNFIRPGALHRANGGTLILDARRVLSQPLAWEALKRTLRSGEIAIESPGRALGLISTRSLEPEPVPLDVKIVLLGERLLYYLLHELDPEFTEFFKVQADFDEETDRTGDRERLYGRMIATMVRRAELVPFDRGAVARVIEHGSRLSADAEKLTMRTRTVDDLLREASWFASQNGRGVTRREDVQSAIDARIRRADRLRERTREAILRDTLYIDTSGEQVGQANGLSVLQLGGHAFGRPARITASVRLGEGEIVDIERESDLGGSVHSKGVMILSSFLKGRYATGTPFSLSASLVFEQSYGDVDGDSASLAELYALLSAIAETPIRQAWAVTGSVDQHGNVQPVGGVNEKIEGFFDICSARGLTGDQGVVIPAANTSNLMLRRDVVAAVEDGDFRIVPVETVDQGMELLTGETMGERGPERAYPDGTVNHRVESRLETFAARRRAFRTHAADPSGAAGPPRRQHEAFRDGPE